MKTINLISLCALAAFFCCCKSATNATNSDGAKSLLEVTQILNATKKTFHENAIATHGDPWKAIMLTASWMQSQPTVQSVSTLDSTYIEIVMKSGMHTGFCFTLIGADGLSIARGGGRTKSAGKESSLAPPLTNHRIENKKVLIYSAGHTEFYAAGVLEKIAKRMSDAGLDVKLLKDDECSPLIIDALNDYGFVILDTHGSGLQFMTGTIIDIDTTIKTKEQLKETTIAQVGQTIYDRMESNDLWVTEYENIPITIANWEIRQQLASIKKLTISQSYLEKFLPSLTNTIVVGNMCYSAEEGAATIKHYFLAKHAISYYGYAFNNGRSSSVSNIFAIAMEDTLTRRLANDLDSTRIANLSKPAEKEYSDPYHQNARGITRGGGQTPEELFFKHFGADDYSYEDCIPFIDSRDGQKYCSIKIGTQTWMAENLRYNAPGSQCYDDDPSKCIVYGRHYDWVTMMQGASTSTANPSGVRGVCPNGWHVPSTAEYTQLVSFLGGVNIAGGKMKKPSSLWDTTGGNFDNSDATNTSGFSALPGGFYIDNAGTISWQSAGYTASFFTTDQATITDPDDAARNVILEISAPGVRFGSNFKTSGYPCRCVKD